VLALYLRDLDRYPVMEREEEAECARRAACGDVSARDKLVASNLRFVILRAKRYATLRLPLSDLIGEGNLGLLQAAENFEPERGYRFITYAIFWIEQALRKARYETAPMVRLPVRQGRLLRRIRDAQQEIVAAGGVPTEKALAERVGATVDQVATLLRYPAEPAALDAPLTSADGDTGDDMYSRIPNASDARPDAELETTALHDSLRLAISKLSAREGLILNARYGLDGKPPRSLEQVAAQQGIVAERVRQLEKRAIAKLRQPAPATCRAGMTNAAAA
jgi:RNA polymerase primary sigma factor